MLLPNPFCPFSAAKIASLQATVLVLISMLIKARIQIKAASALGLTLLALQTLVFLGIGGAAVVAGGAALALKRRQSQPA